MTDRLSLEQLVHLSLGDPEIGAVNFNVLKTLLLQMLQAMNLYNYKPAMSADDQRALREALSKQQGEDSAGGNGNDTKRTAERKKRDRSSDRLNTLEEKVFRFESQLNALDQIPPNSELIDRAKQIPKRTSEQNEQTGDRHGPILEVWQYTQMEKRIESAENGITRLASLLQDLLSDMNDLKESRETTIPTTKELSTVAGDDDINKNDWATKSDIANLDEKIQNLENLLSSLRDRLDSLPKDTSPATPAVDLTGFVTWDRLEDALRGLRESLEKLTHHAQTSARDARSPVQNQSESPSDGLASILEQLRALNDRHEQLRALVEALEEKKLNRDEFEASKNERNNLADRLAAAEKDIAGLRSHRVTDASAGESVKEGSIQSRLDSSTDLSDFRAALQRLREDLDRLKQQLQDVINKGNLSAEDMEALKKLVQQLDQTKADKNHVNNELDKKVDRRDLDNRVLKKDFSAACSDLSQNINDCLQKFHVHDDNQKKDLQKITQDINEKLDRAELDSLRDYMEKQMKKLKKLAKEQQHTQQQHVHVMSEDEAAGLRKQLIRFHCISCDRPIDVQPHPHQPSLPVNQAMRPIQSPRPYTTYELDQIRQFQKSQQFSTDLSSGAADVYATMRQCGGSHTTTLPFKRQIKTQPSVPEETLLARNEVDIKGQDGVIYKGRISVDKLPSLDLHKKNSVVLLAPPPLGRSRSESQPIPFPYPQQRESPALKRVSVIEQQIHEEAQTFVVMKKEEDFATERYIFDWDDINLEDILEVHRVNWKDCFEQCIEPIREKKPCNHKTETRRHSEVEEEEVVKRIEFEDVESNALFENEQSSPSTCPCDAVFDDDHFSDQQPIHDVEPNEKTDDQLDEKPSAVEIDQLPDLPTEESTVPDNELTIVHSLIVDILNGRLSVHDHLSSNQNTPPSLLKLDKTTSIPSLALTPSPPSNTFTFETTTSRHHTLGKHADWIAQAGASYVHPFHAYCHYHCSLSSD